MTFYGYTGYVMHGKDYPQGKNLCRLHFQLKYFQGDLKVNVIFQTFVFTGSANILVSEVKMV